jgi:hypothetical protein
MVRILIILVIFLAMTKYRARLQMEFTVRSWGNESYDTGLLAKIWGDVITRTICYTFGSDILGGHLIDKKSLQK